MVSEVQERRGEKKGSFGQLNWYQVIVFFLAFISLVTINRSGTGDLAITAGINQTTLILVVLAFLPWFITFLIQEIPKGKLAVGVGNLINLSLEFENIQQIIAGNLSKHASAGEEAKDPGKGRKAIGDIQQSADTALESTVNPQALPIVQLAYLQKLDVLVKKFNHNRHDRELKNSSVQVADQIAYEMRSIAPLLFGKLDIAAWLDNPNPGKRLAAIKYLDWAQDIDYAENLANRLQKIEQDGDTFQAYHILLAIYSMANQLAYDYKKKVELYLEGYTPDGGGASSRKSLRDNILKTLNEPA